MSNLFAAPTRDTSKPQILNYEGVGNCCGAGWIAHFPEPHTYYPDPERSRTTKYGVKPEHISMVKSDLALMDKKRFSINMVALNHKQKEYWGDMLKEFGYKAVVKDKYHTWAGNLLTIYVKTRYKMDKKGNPIDTCKDGGDPEDFDEDYDD